MHNKKISVVTTAYRGKELITTLIKRIKSSLAYFSNYEVIFLVDNHYLEISWHVIQEHAKGNSKIKGVKLSANFVQQIAMSALQKTKTKIIVQEILEEVVFDKDEVIPYNLKKAGKKAKNRKVWAIVRLVRKPDVVQKIFQLYKLAKT